MADANVPAANAAPNLSANPTDALASTKAPVSAPDIKSAAAPVDKVAADKLKAETPAEKEVIRKLKVGDTEYDETTLQQMIEKAKGADKKFLEASKARKEALRFFKMAKENPREFLAQTGLDPKKFAYDEVAEDIKNKLRDPREVELEQATKRLKEFEAKEEAEKARVKQDKQDKEAAAWKNKFEQDIIDALETTPTIPKNGFTVAKVAKYIATVREKTGVLLSAKEVVSVIEKDIQSEMKGILTGADAQKLIALIGEEGLAVLRKYDLERLKDPLKGGKGGSGIPEEKPKAKRWNSASEFWKSIDKDAKAERGE